MRYEGIHDHEIKLFLYSYVLRNVRAQKKLIPFVESESILGKSPVSLQCIKNLSDRYRVSSDLI